MSFLGLPAVIAAIVYLVDVRPAVRGSAARQQLVSPRWPGPYRQSGGMSSQSSR